MPLSEYEQRVLEQLERDLGADPKLGQAMARAPRSRSRLTWAVLGVVVGLAIVLMGAILQQPLIGIAGFALMTFAALWAMIGPTRRTTSSRTAKGGAAPSPSAKTQGNGDFMRRVEDRFDRRRQQGDL